MSSHILRVDGLAKSFGGLQAVDRASFDVQEGSITALIGPNGAGKTTLFNLVSGLIATDSGSVSLDGRDITRHRPHDIARRGLIRTFQQPRTVTRMTVRDNLHLAAARQPGERLRDLVVGRRRTRAREVAVEERAGELLELFDLGRVADDYGGTLSGGQRKLLELARALMAEPRLLLLDEPLAGVNPTLGRRIEELIIQMRAEHDLTVLFIEHDLPAVMRLSDRVIVMSQGTVIARGEPEEVRRDQLVLDAYLGTHGETGGAPS